MNDIEISRICASVTGESTFWISKKNKVFGCGRNNKNQLGLPDDYVMNRNEPTMVKYLNNIIDIKCACNYSLALGTININNVIEYWYYEIFSISSFIPIDVINEISKFHGWSVYSTEYSLYGGNGHGTNNKNNKQWKKIEALANVDIIKIETGYYHSLFLEATGFLWSCGDNDHGQCGRDNESGEELSTSLPKPIEFFLKRNIKIKEIKSGHYHNLAIDEKDRIWSWGQNRYGQCGDGTLGTVYEPKLIRSLIDDKIKKIECGANHSYAMTMDNRHYLWGSNKYCECLLFSGEEKVKIPMEVEMDIDEIFLGDRDTKWIVRGNDGYLGYDGLRVEMQDMDKCESHNSMASVIVYD